MTEVLIGLEAGLRCTMDEWLEMAADSTDRRNTLCEFLRWRLILQGLARPLIQLARDGAQLCLGMNRQVSASRQILSQQPVGVLV